MHFNISREIIMHLKELALPYKVLVMLIVIIFIIILAKGYNSYYKERKNKSK